MISRIVRFAKIRFFRLFARRRAREIVEHAACSPGGPFQNPPPEGHLRGIDHFDRKSLIGAIAHALAVYRASGDRFPDLINPVAYSEKLNHAKFFAAMRIPESGNKSLTASFIPDHLKTRLHCPEIVWRSPTAVLPRNGQIPDGIYYLKTNHGSSMVRRVVYPLSEASRKALEGTFARFLRIDYGARTGEWWYSVFDREVILEKAVCHSVSPVTLLFYAIAGQIAMISVDQKPLEKGRITKTLYFDGNFNLDPLQKDDEEKLHDFEISDELKYETLAIAKDIARQFVCIRIDLIIGDDNRIYLNEITHISSGGTPIYNRQLDIDLGKKWIGQEIYSLP